MDIRQLFKDKINKLNNKKYEPKFKVGDIILNNKYKIARKILEIIPEENDVKGERSQYKTINIHNPLATTNKNNRYYTYKYCINIDSYYNKVDERTVTILFGAMNEKE